jgi:hypothetical protein
LAEKKNVVVPSYITHEDLLSRCFSKSRYLHLSNSQRDIQLRAKRIEVLDADRRIYRLTEAADRRRFFIASSSNGSGAVSMEVPQSIQHILAAEITGMHAAAIAGD